MNVLWPFFVRVLGIGAMTFGGGYAMISALQQELVARRAWLTQSEFGSGVAVGQITPGPLMIMIAFLGYKIAGIWGAFLGTIGLFMPSFLLVLLLSKYHERVKTSPITKAMLRGVNAAVVGLLAAAVVNLSIGSLSGITPLVIALAGALLIGLAGIEPAWVLLGAGVLGALFIK